MPKKLNPDAVSKKVMRAASLCVSSCKACISACASAPNWAKPATASSNSGGDQGCGRACHQTKQHIDGAGNHRGPIAARWIGIGIGLGAHGGGDGREIDSMAAKTITRQGKKPRHAQQRRHGRVIAVQCQHSHAGNILRGHGNQKQRQADADKTGP